MMWSCTAMPSGFAISTIDAFLPGLDQRVGRRRFCSRDTAGCQVPADRRQLSDVVARYFLGGSGDRESERVVCQRDIPVGKVGGAIRGVVITEIGLATVDGEVRGVAALRGQLTRRLSQRRIGVVGRRVAKQIERRVDAGTECLADRPRASQDLR